MIKFLKIAYCTSCDKHDGLCPSCCEHDWDWRAEVCRLCGKEMPMTNLKGAITVPHMNGITRSIRFQKELLDQLDKEAEADGRSFGDYVKRLIATHPARQKIKKAKKR